MWNWASITEFLRKNQKYVIGGLAVLLILFIWGVQFVAVRVSRMEQQMKDHSWIIPSTVYAEAPELRAGSRKDQKWLENYLENLNYGRTSLQNLKAGQFRSSGKEVVFHQRKQSESAASIIKIEFKSNAVGKIVDLESGSQLKEIQLEPAALSTVYGTKWQKRTLVKLNELPQHVIDTVVAVEDRRFYAHPGVDFRAIVRALWNNIRSDERLQGASTITQQVVKNFYLTPERSIRRKLKEAAMAVWLERRFSKEQILEFYLNDVYLGQSGPANIRGIGEASKLYFNKDARLMTVPEAALLAGMIQAPHRYDPNKLPENAKDRRDKVLQIMLAQQLITPAQYEKYVSIPVRVQSMEERSMKSPYFVHAVLKFLPDELGSSDLSSSGYKIFTTLDLDMQKTAEETLREGLERIDKINIKKNGKQIQGCLIAVEPSTGKIRAFVGGRDFNQSQFDRITQSMRQPGSVFKPFVYAAAMETAFNNPDYFYTPATLISDDPISIEVKDAVWEPENYDGGNHGIVSAREALERSLNVATIRLSQQVGLQRITELSREMGLKNVKAYPSLALGAFEVSPWDLIGAYTAFANGGNAVELSGIESVISSSGKTLLTHKPHQRRVLREQTAFLITDMLRTALITGTGASVRNYGLSGPIAGKTGTSDDYKDAWFIGYSPDLITLVWVGYDDNTKTGLTGAEAALPIWAQFMKKADGISDRKFQIPQGIVAKVIDPVSGKLATGACYYGVTEFFIMGTEPGAWCTDFDHQLDPYSFEGATRRLPFTFTREIIAAEDQQDNQEESLIPQEGPTYFAAPPKKKKSYQHNEMDR